VPPITKSIALFVLLLFALEAKSQSYELTPAPFNSSEADFGGTFYGSHFIYSSARQKTEITYNEDTIHHFFTDLFQTTLNTEGEWEEPTAIRGQVNTIMNEAQCTFTQDGKVMYFTGNLKNALSQKKDKSEKYALGIMSAKKFNREWILDKEFQYNSSNSSYSCGHPYIANNDSLLLFSSNQPGGHGGSDLYYCLWQNNAWTTPTNFGPTINTSGNEFYPFIDEFGVLYFTSDSRKDSEGLDIYSAQIKEGGTYLEPVRLPEPINSDDDDFAYSEKKGSNRGCISSNRDGDNDDVYFFTRYDDDFKHCITNAPPFFCYLFSDENYPIKGNLPYVFMWRFNDGDSIHGSQVKKCFKDFGHYTYALEVFDTLTRRYVMTANEDEIEINRPESPYIDIPPKWSTRQYINSTINIPSALSIDTTTLEWTLNDRVVGTGKQFRWKPDTEGEFMLNVRMKTKGTKRVSPKSICVEQPIVIQADSVHEKYPPIIPIPISYPEVVRNLQGQQVFPRYYIALCRSTDSLRINDPCWGKAPKKVLEMTNQKEFIYVIEQTNDMSELLQLFRDYRDKGYDVQIVQSMSTDNVYDVVREMSSHLPNAENQTTESNVNKTAINTDNTKESVALNANTTQQTAPLTTAYIATEEDYTRKVKYVAAVMNIEQDMTLQIICEYSAEDKAEAAHTMALQIRELLIQLHVKPEAIAIATRHNMNVLPQQQIKLILQYPFSSETHE
jgi:hypothetical protein